jgi:uncharacterized Zn finger protein (UPF0148 family)
MSTLTCPRCGLALILDELPKYGTVSCTDCGEKIDPHSVAVPEPIRLASGEELDADAAKVRAMVEEIKRRR